MDSIPQKQCTKCKEWFPQTIEYFYKCKTNKCGLMGSCKSCKNARTKELNSSPERHAALQAYMKKYNASDKAKASDKARNQSPQRKQYMLEKQRQFSKTEKGKACALRSAHSQKRRDWEKGYNQRPYRKAYTKFYNKAGRIKRRAIIKNLTEHHNHKDIQVQFKMQKGKCWWCGCELTKKYHVDHRIPLSRGGSNAANNICISCPHCNLSKHDKLPHEWGNRLL